MTFLEQVGKAVVDWAKFKPKDEYETQQASGSIFDGDGWVAPQTCFITLHLRPQNSSPSRWYVQEKESQQKTYTKSDTGANDSNFLVAIKGHTYKTIANEGNTIREAYIVYPKHPGGGML